MAARQHPSPWAVTGWVISALSLIVGVLGLLVASVRAWLADNGITAWIITMAVIILAPGVCALVIRQRLQWIDAEAAHRRCEEQDRRDWEAAQRAQRVERASLHADITLVRDLLDGWTVDSDFYAYMSHRVHWKAFPAKYRRAILDHRDRWERDNRTIEDPDLAGAFAAVREGLRDFDTHIGTHLSGDPTRDYEYLTVSLDEPWKQNAYNDLIPSANHLTDALSNLYALLHRLGVRAQA